MNGNSMRLTMCLCVALHAGNVLAAEKPAYQPIDWNRDGVFDLVDASSQVAATDRTTLRVYTGISGSEPPKFSPPKDVVIEGGAASALSLTDYDGDGDVDLLGYSEGHIRVCENKAEKGAAVRLD